MVAGGLKYYVWPTATFKKRWGLYGQTPTSVPADLFGAIPAAPRNLTAVIKSPYSDSIYYIDRGGRRFYVWPSDTFKTRWGIKNEDVVVMPDSFVRSLPYAGRLTGLVRGETISQVYYIDRGGRKYPVWPTDIFWGRWGFNRDFDVVTISDAQLRWMTTERWLTGLVRGDQDGQLYWIDYYGKKFKIPFGMYFWNQWNFKLEDVTVISQAQLDCMEYGGELSLYIKGELSPLVCRMTNGRCPITSWVPWGQAVTTISQGQFNYMPR